ncbi:putative serine/threonine protein kinase [Aspergillus candidus]|uniref:non-specific serine/threonine protein kinase n=1 Tax=Aspergillus candidus TaxID=41067 RepID=A0A2I2FB08_ASPCN|nr:putative serine/threonine protein kinase [Aspergillus candidus]PLB37821.1 putative serine/threonine protein kinase [Aspergillus candidus]
MDASRASQLLDPTSAVAAITKHKAEAIKLAREQAAAVQEMCRRAKTEMPPYEFEELIGKGSYGRVYKGHQLPSRQVVAIKVMDVDTLDYKTLRDFKDDSIKEFIHETKVMKQVKDSGAKNINELIEAISIHSQLWLVCEYCPGGSVRTLMRATGDRLDEKFIIPIARELAAGLRAIHNAGIIHRDIKAANILIHEEGRLEICDFGVAGVLQSQMDKRSTWIGTPHWMPPEMFSTRGEAHQYGSEIDVWAYGCTLFEFASGNPPNANLRERMQIGRQLNRNAPKLKNDKYSDELKDLVAFALESDPIARPAMDDILDHAYIANTEEEYPTSSLSELVRIYYQWSQRGGQRISLFHPGGAAAAEMPDDGPDVELDWNFSATDGFERRFSVIDLDQLAASLAEMEDKISPTTSNDEAEADALERVANEDMSEDEKANFDERVRRGAEAMEGLFNEELPDYKYETKNDFIPIEQKQPMSDLPLRTETDRSSVTSTFIDIDIGSFDSSHYAAGASTTQPFQLADADTIKANRTSGRQHRDSGEARSRSSSGGLSSDRESQDLTYQPQSGPRPPTMDWKFPSFTPQDTEAAPADEGQNNPTHTEGSPKNTEPEEFIPTEKRATMEWKFPEAPTPAPNPAPAPAKPPTTDESDQAARRATMEWTFPSMGGSADADQDSQGNDVAVEANRFSTLKAPLPPLEPSETAIRPLSIGEPGDARPSTSNSAKSSFSASSDTDYDPFRLDRPPSLSGDKFAPDDFPQLLDSADHDAQSRSSVIVEDGPGPDEEDDVIEEEDERQLDWQSNTTATTAASDAADPGSDSEPFPAALMPTDEAADPTPLPTARRVPHIVEPVYFPDLVPPDAYALAANGQEGTMKAELDRLLEDFLDALSATGEGLARTRVSPETTPNGRSTPEGVE